MEKKYFTYFNKEEAKEYIGKKCRFADYENLLAEGDGSIGILSDVLPDKDAIFSFRSDDDDWHRFCTPVETKIRPYKDFKEMTRDAFKHGFDCMIFKIIGKNKKMYCVALLSDGVVVYYYRNTEDIFISFKELAEKYTWLDGTPCGVEEEV